MSELASVPDAAPIPSVAGHFARQRAAFDRSPDVPWRVRVDRLDRLRAILRTREEEICAAVSADFGHRSADETRLLELFPSLEAIKHARRHTRRWMRDERRATSLWFLPGRSRVVHQPLGVVGIIVPWNYPIFLAVSPLAAALAAGNRAMVKMSELSPRFGGVLAEAVAQAFAPAEVTIVNGDVEVARAFGALPFDHLLFTGSTGVGRQVMRAAAAALTPVTLELGGKSPAIVAPGYWVEHAAERIVVGKLMNAGQTCIAPDYALVPKPALPQFVATCRKVAQALYPEWATSADYSTIVSARHFARLQGLVDDARARGARIEAMLEGQEDVAAQTRRFPGLLVVDAPPEARLVCEEIFGPILLVVSYGTLEEAIAYVNAHARPLALYYFDRDGARIDKVLRETHAGGVTVNDVILHIAQEDLPFGGIGASGMGQYHGREGFETFSKKKAVFVQSRLNTMRWFKPPYGARFRRLVRLLLR
jgi:aldehyde dehydrogenase (NAD+)/coniferyl-aldehyde dehydrogenase